MKVHKHIGIIEAADEMVLREALVLAGVPSAVLVWLAPNIAVLEREAAQAVAVAMRKSDLHPKVIE